MPTATVIARNTFKDNQRPDVCARCTNVCCDGMPGETHPGDLADDRSKLTAALVERLKTGQWAIDWWEGDVLPKGRMRRVMYLRPAIVGEEGRIEHPAWHGRCTFLGPAGCSLSWQERPSGCKALIPNPVEPGNCDGDELAGKDAAARAWRPYQAQIRAAIAASV